VPHPTLGLSNNLLLWFGLFCSCCWDGESENSTDKLCWDGWDGMGRMLTTSLSGPMEILRNNVAKNRG
jgi:hypothetical protein